MDVAIRPIDIARFSAPSEVAVEHGARGPVGERDELELRQASITEQAGELLLSLHPLAEFASFEVRQRLGTDPGERQRQRRQPVAEPLELDA